MIENRKSDISALMDGELGGEAATRVISQVCADPAQLTTWRNFHLIGDALRGDPVLTGPASIDGGVMASLEREPTILSPRRHDALPRRVLAGSIAASVAALAVFILQGRVAEVESEATPGLAVVASAAGGQAMPATSIATRPVQADDLQRYFMNHNELRASQALRLLPPHASLVGFSPAGAEPQPLSAGPSADSAR